MRGIVHISDINAIYNSPICLCAKPEVLARTIFESHAVAELFLINVNYKTDGVLRSQNPGIELLKLLRLYGLRQHCVLYSFLSREQVMVEQPHNLIIFSEGVTFLRMPADFSKLNFEELAKKLAPVDLSPFLKAESHLPDDRHFFANWWGVLQLWYVQKAVERIAGKTHLSDIEKTFGASVKEMNSYQGLLARYLKGKNETDIERSLKKLSILKTEKFENEKRKTNEIQEETERIAAEKEIIASQIEVLEEISETDKNNIVEKIRSRISKLPNSLQQKLHELQQKQQNINNQIQTNAEYIELIELIDKEKDRVYEEYRKKNRQLTLKISSLEKTKHFSTLNFSLEAIREKLSNEKPKIVYVDDQASDGWASVFQRMIYGEESDSFTIIEPKESDSIELISNTIYTTIKQKKADLLILDLRLKSEKGSIVDASKISGVQVLKLLHEQNISCPVLITTASNKLWSYKETFANGATAFWTKEGLDEHYDTDASVENYLRFLDLVYLLCFNDEIHLLYKDFLDKIITFEKSQIIGLWETKFWGDKELSNPKSQVVIRQDIVNCLYQAFQIYENALRLKIQNIENVQLEKNIYSLIVLQLAEIIELIHKDDSNSTSAALSEKIKEQLGQPFFDKWKKNLFAVRNDAAHMFNIDYSKLKSFIGNIFGYLYFSDMDVYFDEKDIYAVKKEDPVDGKVYTSTIHSNHPTSQNMYFIKNPNLNLSRTHILMLTGNVVSENRDELKVGSKVEFKLDIRTVRDEIKYYASEIRIIELN